MNRPLKFRAWDTTASCEMSYSGEFSLDGVESPINKLSMFFSWLQFRPKAVLMQYTGLKDKNGKEIYEGDIITSGTSYNLEVFWMGIAWGVRWKDMGNDEEGIICDDGGDMGMDDKGNMLYMEIIGNIYEHPELLKP